MQEESIHPPWRNNPQSLQCLYSVSSLNGISDALALPLPLPIDMAHVYLTYLTCAALHQ